MYETIVVPTDGSEFSTRAAKLARDVATTFDATVQVLTVVDENAATSVFERADIGDEVRAQLREEAANALESTEAVLADHGSVETATVDGKTTESILAYVEEVNADLVIMGTHGRTGLDRYVAGSVTERVLRRTPVPVLTVTADRTPRVPDEYEHVLLPVDGSEAAETAIEHAIELATPGDATVHVVNVIDVGALAGSGETASTTDALEAVSKSGETATTRVAERISATGLDVETAVLKGSPGHMLLEYADDHDVDVVTMTTTGRTGLDRYLLGSTTERLVRNADRPVLAVNTRNTSD